ncbi:MAG: hypothetical protein F7C08_03960 [Desulfurococcales archaeon]|nr:hypothetical protein [Desulfurococcales archaeon]
MADIGGNIKLPSFSFKEYVNTVVVDVNELNELPYIIMNIIEKSIEIKYKDTIILLNIILSTDLQFEIRIWINPAKNEAIIMHNIDNELFDINRLYKVAIEEFRATEIAASLDHEIAGNLGIKITRIDLSMLPSILHSILKIDEAVVKKVEEKADDNNTTVNEIVNLEYSINNASRFDVISMCLDKIWEVCGSINCMEAGRNPAEMVSKYGVAVLGKDGEYVCIIRGDQSCQFIVSVFKKDVIESICIDTFDGLKSIIENISVNGYVNVLL